MAKMDPAVTQEAIHEDLVVAGVSVTKATITSTLKHQGMFGHGLFKSRKHLKACLIFTHADDTPNQ